MAKTSLRSYIERQALKIARQTPPQNYAPAETFAQHRCGLVKPVLTGFDGLLRDLLPERNRVEWLVLRQAAQDCHLRTQHVAVSHVGDDFPCGSFNLL